MAPPESRNYRVGIISGVLFTIADSLMDPTLVMVAFMSNLTNSPVLIGLVVPLRNGGWFLPQLYVSTFLQSRPYKKPFYGAMAVIRALTWGIMAASLAWVDGHVQLLTLFLILFAINSCVAGFGGLAYMSIFAKAIPPQRRSEFYAIQLAIGGLFGIGGGLVVRAVLATNSSLAFPQNFLLLFALAFGLAILSLLAYMQIVEPPDDQVPRGTTLRSQLRKARRVLATDLTYQVFLKLRMALMISGMATPFYLVWARLQFGLTAEWVGLSLTVLVAATTLSYMLFGYFSRRGVSNQALITIAALASLLMSLLILILMLMGTLWRLTPSAAGLCLLLVFVLSSIREAGINVTATALLLDLAPVMRRALYVGLTHSMLGIVLLVTVAGGIIVAVAGYVTLFALALLANIIALRYAYQRQQTRLQLRTVRLAAQSAKQKEVINVYRERDRLY
jgi:MFS family permease